MPGLSVRWAQPRRPATAALLGLTLAAAAAQALHLRRGGAEALSGLDEICSSDSGPIFSSAPGDSAAAGRPATRVQQLSCEPLPEMPGKRVSTVLVEFPPGAYSGPHRHPGSVSAVVIAGRVRSKMQGTPAQDYGVGQTWFEPARRLHELAENPDPVHPATLIAHFVTDENCGPLVIPEPQ